jgi:ABC-type transporter Mla maintaining outer membrane lipid asymmetry ATPase subunit MlaF
MAREMASVERTLVKSPPELWELLDDRELMRRWAAELERSDDPFVQQFLRGAPDGPIAFDAAPRADGVPA